MKHLRLVFASMAIVVTGVWAIAAVAGDQKSSSAANGACPTMTAAECRAKMAAGQTCPMKGASATSASAAAMGSQCAGHGAATASASGECCAHGVNAMTVSNTGKCAAHGANAAGHEGCSMKGTGATAAGHGLCPEHNVSAMAAGLGSNCGAHEHGTGVMAHADCDACDDLAACDAELQAAGAAMQTVPIKNGVMFVYTASSPGRVNAIQSVMARRTEHLSRIVASGTRARLCDDCKSMRGAMASGRMVREVVNIEGGTLVLVTSDDAALIKRIRDLADAGKTAVKS